MNWQLLLPLIITVIVAILGWFIAHVLTRNRDRANKLRDIRLQYLIEAYRRLGDAAMRHLPSEPEYAQRLESALADIQLFGSITQVEKLKKMFEDYAANEEGSLDEVINDLRDELRKELDLLPISGNVQWLRIRQPANKSRR
ncbi:MAG: hypothetical protein ACJ74W_16785 [Pyrinomonadaceae bacterium]